MRIFTRSLKTQFIEAFTLLILLSSCFLAAITGREASSEARYERGLLLTNRVQSLAKALDQSMWFWIKEVDTLRHTVGLIGGDMKKTIHRREPITGHHARLCLDRAHESPGQGFCRH